MWKRRSLGCQHPKYNEPQTRGVVQVQGGAHDRIVAGFVAMVILVEERSTSDFLVAEECE